MLASLSIPPKEARHQRLDVFNPKFHAKPFADCKLRFPKPGCGRSFVGWPHRADDYAVAKNVRNVGVLWLLVWQEEADFNKALVQVEWTEFDRLVLQTEREPKHLLETRVLDAVGPNEHFLGQRERAGLRSTLFLLLRLGSVRERAL